MNDLWVKELNSPIVEKAYAFAKEAYKGLKRKSGEDFITHPLAVAEIVYNWKLDENSIAAALLHDVVEDTSYTFKDLSKNFNEDIVFLVKGLTKLKTIHYDENKDAENLRKFIVYFSQDIRVLLIKIADRLHNMKTLNFISDKEKQKRIALETLEIYAPLAYRLGMQKISGELEDLAFPYVYPEEYKWLMEELKNDNFEERQKYAEILIPKVEKALKEHNIYPLSINARAKHYYSLYRKLLRYDMDLSKIYDLVALRVIVKTVEECYLVLGVIHNMWQPILGKIKDYIARPKSNGYKSLHTTVITDEGRIIEIQIRTEEMHRENELGIAAHWAYSQIKSSKDIKEKWQGVKSKKDLLWVNQLRDWMEEFTSSSNQKEFIEAIKNDFLKDRIFVFTPENDIIDLPYGSTPVDFAYRIHSQIGDNCVGAKVNGKLVPLDYKLNLGDTVEILTQKGKKPSEDWLQFVKTESAKKYIKKALRAKNQNLIKKEKEDLPKFWEIKIVNIDRPGYLKDITEIFAFHKINIFYLKSEKDKNSLLSVIYIRVKYFPLKTLEPIIVKIKRVKDTKEISYRAIR
jgi:GTP pyrophosphokinase